MDREITLRDYGRVLWSGRWLVLATTLAALVVALLLTVAKTTTYTARSSVYLGQATTPSGQPVATGLTSPVSAAAVLGADEFAKATGEKVGLGGDDAAITRVRDAVSFTIARAAGNAGVNQPTIATVVATDRSRKLAREMANAYAETVQARAASFVQPQVDIRADQLRRLETRRRDLADQATTYRRLLANASSDRAVGLAAVLQNITSEQYIVANDISQNLLDAEKAKQIELPSILTRAVSATSSGGARNRLQRAIFGAIIGAILGMIATLVWKGGPTGREAEPR